MNAGHDESNRRRPRSEWSRPVWPKCPLALSVQSILDSILLQHLFVNLMLNSQIK